MIDFVKILNNDINSINLECNPLLDFFQDINLDTAEIRTVNRWGNKITSFKNAFYNSLEFRIYDTGTITIAGSLHKYWNSGAHNYNDFNYDAFLWVLNDLNSKFNIKPQQCILRCLEVGVNVKPPLQSNHILNYSFLHKTKYLEWRINSDEGKYKQCQHSQYIVKLYNKTVHYKAKGFNVQGEILRFEIKYTKMKRANTLGVYNLQDIADLGFNTFKGELTKEWQNVLYFDNTIKAQTRRLSNYKNPLYWNELLSRPTKTNYYKHKKILSDLTQNSSDKIQEKLSQIIINKIDDLDTKGASIYPLNILSNHTPLNISTDNKCKVTGMNISMQKADSFLLSHTGLKYYYKTDKKIFKQIKRHYLTKRWWREDYQTQIKEIAHNIRNRYNNKKLSKEKNYNPNQLGLFK